MSNLTQISIPNDNDWHLIVSGSTEGNIYRQSFHNQNIVFTVKDSPSTYPLDFDTSIPAFDMGSMLSIGNDVPCDIYMANVNPKIDVPVLKIVVKLVDGVAVTNG